ncbi:MAG: hypothetical protein KGS61_14410, partial [Verrucomicrobia bacterium]|nr:hypothetical protein [Verrucomicrobiota bacterium]
ADLARRWEAADSSGGKDIRVQAGVYRSGSRWLAVNRPGLEDEPEVLEPEQARRLFGALPFNTLAERSRQTTSLQGEIWRLFLLAMLTFLVVEAILIRPPKPSAAEAVADRFPRRAASGGVGEAA